MSSPTRRSTPPAFAVKIARAIDDVVPTSPIVLVGSDTGALFAAVLVGTGQLERDGLILAGLPLVQYPDITPASWDDELDVRITCPTHRLWLV
jgi:hypothetical protein